MVFGVGKKNEFGVGLDFAHAQQNVAQVHVFFIVPRLKAKNIYTNSHAEDSFRLLGVMSAAYDWPGPCPHRGVHCSKRACQGARKSSLPSSPGRVPRIGMTVISACLRCTEVEFRDQHPDLFRVWEFDIVFCQAFGDKLVMNDLKLHDGIAIIEVTDPLILTEIESDAGLQPFLGDRLSETCIAVQPQAIQEVTRRLQSLGHMPRVRE